MLEEDKDIPGCPESFRLNCSNYFTKCNSCKTVTETGDGFYYEPIIKDPSYSYTRHPYRIKTTEEKNRLKKESYKEKQEYKQTDKVRASRKYNRLGKKIERDVIKSIEGAKLTYASGSISHDGDGYIYLGDSKYVFSHKQRFSNRNQLGPTSKEWVEGLSEGCDIWLTSSKDYGTIVTMNKDIFDELIKLIKERRDNE